ncbi:MAG: NAD(P)-dependent oxidoreductase [Chitinophagales bacterium]
MRKILFINEAHPFLAEKLISLGFECHFHYETSKAEIEKMLPNFFGIVIKSRFKIDANFIDKAIKLQFIARIGAGLESIDTTYAQKKEIACLSSPEGNRDAVGEHSVALLLNVLNHISIGNQQVKKGFWWREANRGTEIKGKTIGIVGYGNMGRAFAKCLYGFGAKVIAYDKYKTDYGDKYAEAVDLEKFYAESDIVSLHTYYIPENHYFFDDVYINNFHKNIYVINTARGKILNTADLVKHLKTGKVLGAGLDVLEYEGISFENIKINDLPLPFQDLIAAENVVLTPHVAGWTHEGKRKHAETLAQKIEKQFCQ